MDGCAAVAVLAAPAAAGPEDAIAAALDELRVHADVRVGWEAKPTHEGEWIYFQPRGAVLPPQGWKLHVAATILTAPGTLRRIGPVLLAHGVAWKAAASWRFLVDLNDGNGGLSQVGKFVTVYPRNDEEAVRVAVALDQATRGLHGPPIPSDRRLNAGSVVWYRYGGFDGRMLQNRLGEVQPAITGGAGELVADRRGGTFEAPAWAADPFEAAGVAGGLPEEPGGLVGGRYLPVARLSQTARGTVLLGVDTERPRRCILKSAWRHALVDRHGYDACDRLRHEAAILRRMSPDPRFPAVFDLLETPDGATMVLEDMDGRTLETAVRELSINGRRPAADDVLRWGRDVALACGALHRAGIVFRDLKSSNVMLDPDGRARLFDLELSHELSSAEPPRGRGTRGYMSPRQEAGEPPAPDDDVYALGCLLWFLATGVEPGRVPRWIERVVELVPLLNSAAPAGFASFISRCLEVDPALRPASMQAAADELEALRGRPRAPIPPPAAPTGADRERWRGLARRVGDSLCALAETSPDGVGLVWRSREGVGKRSFHHDVNTGTAGIVLALTEIAPATGDPRHLRALRGGASWLAHGRRPVGLAGLYVGEAGVGAALLRAGLVLDDPELLEAAVERSLRVAAEPLASPDLFNGAAGRLRFHLAVWDALGGDAHLRAALAAGEWLLACAGDAEGGGTWWTMPEGYGSLSGTVAPGYAHGAAGIADVLLDLHGATGDERFADAARGAAEWLERIAFPVLDDDSGLDWPAELGGEGRIGPFWCHGSAGVARFLLHAARLELTPGAAETGVRAARAAGRGARWSAVSLCHGIPGSLDVLVDAWQATGDPAWLAEGRGLAQLLEALSMEVDGNLVWPYDSPRTYTPDLMVGFSGVAVALLRLADADTRAPLLSRHGLVLAAPGTDPAHRRAAHVQPV
ncbi:MAG: uncharacterized protein JWM27_3557 [Gemmatimonadetes bacterium]|nr:uncharacterized protein [Gemmatimonadota bacterium]